MSSRAGQMEGTNIGGGGGSVIGPLLDQALCESPTLFNLENSGLLAPPVPLSLYSIILTICRMYGPRQKFHFMGFQGVGTCNKLI